MAKVEPIYAGADVRAWSGKRLLRAPQAAARIPPGEWVEAVVATAGGDGE